jgi:Integrase core domain
MLRTMYVLFAIHLGSRRAHVLGVTKNPDSAWVTQQARNLAVGERLDEIRFVIRDRDLKLPGPFDEVFRSEGIRIIKTPILTPLANAYAERWVRTVRTECLDWILVLGRRHLEHVLRAYAAHYNGRNPHRSLELKTPERRPGPARWPVDGARVRTRDVLGGLIHEYDLAAWGGDPESVRPLGPADPATRRGGSDRPRLPRCGLLPSGARRLRRKRGDDQGPARDAERHRRPRDLRPSTRGSIPELVEMLSEVSAPGSGFLSRV